MMNATQAAGSQFESRLRDAVMEHSMLKHPFYVACTECKLSRSMLAEYAKPPQRTLSLVPPATPIKDTQVEL
jgi:pyrroloquinoline quinone (PQQ) biosynthesis protein C